MGGGGVNSVSEEEWAYRFPLRGRTRPGVSADCGVAVPGRLSSAGGIGVVHIMPAPRRCREARAGALQAAGSRDSGHV